MRVKLSLGWLGLCAVSLGCSHLPEASVYNLAFEAGLRTDECLGGIRDRLLADDVWKDLVKAHPGSAYSKDYAVGFKQGFTDYVEMGGCGNAPPTPPPHYRTLHYQTPQGHHAIEEWYAGFRHGAAVAREGGYRQFIIVPSSTVMPGPCSPPPYPHVTPSALEPTFLPGPPVPSQGP
jgi:hypothetical protein